jgi:hypothetical protein
MPLPVPKQNERRRFLPRIHLVLIGLLAGFVGLSLLATLGSRTLVYNASKDVREYQEIAAVSEPPQPFPIGVDPVSEEIVEHTGVETFFDETDVPPELAHDARRNWFDLTFARLAQSVLFQNLASPTGRVLVILPGERREEVSAHFAKLLSWDKAERARFTELVASSTPELSEGKFTPSKYLLAKDAAPEDAARLVLARFDSEIASRYTDEIAEKVPLKQALTIASLLEREAYDFTDMRYISGIIWNRLFAGMKLQLDASLQYAKGSRAKERSWWPKVVPADKYIASAYNTYKHEGLPPGPIANPSMDAILAALNPRKTDCMFYFHDKKGGFHCTETYEEHVAMLKQYYGRGK